MFQFIYPVNWSLLAMLEVNISPLLSLALFYLTQQLIYKGKIEKNDVRLDISVSDTSIVKNFHLPGLEKKHYSYLRTFTLFWIRFCYLYYSKPRKIWGSRPCHRGTNISALFNDWKNIIVYWKNPNKTRPCCWQVRFVLYCK